jgi:hypothetical protein
MEVVPAEDRGRHCLTFTSLIEFWLQLMINLKQNL